MLASSLFETRSTPRVLLASAAFSVCLLTAAVSGAQSETTTDSADTAGGIPPPPSRIIGPRGATGVIRRSDRRQDHQREEDLEDLKDLNNAVDRNRPEIQNQGAAGGRRGTRR